MIDWFTTAQIAVATLAGLLGVALGLAGRKPNDLTMGATALVEVLLLAQVVVAIVAPLAGNPPTGNLIEYWAYLISAVLVPPLAGFWALVERTRWSTVILGTACLAIAVMLYRMNVIWTVQLA
ncbi:hypothetical protein [Planctomonas psychrotolerans]|uniref:hypothetical protein n=1 Tax=Planctomonas psychrotolerans TaxID=2528712 RepID=UPI00123B1AC0|nr:hypothetical protein [Planctomonas psychrotolerans]